MLVHHARQPEKPARVLILGAAGFVGRASAERLRADGVEVVALGRHDVDLLAADADDKLTALVRPGDTLVLVSALAPCKNTEMLIDNLRMVQPVCRLLERVELRQIVYISSDAVYADIAAPLTEQSCASPTTHHGIMHLAREVVLAASARCPLAILRPTLIYGAADPHNGYGPNRFRRLAAEGKDITLFGNGEERRDHVFIDDVAELVRLIVAHRSAGSLNAATGVVTSFKEIAEMVVALSGKSVVVLSSPRQGPMPHDGYRPFDPAATLQAFPGFRYTPLAAGLKASAA